MFRIIQLVAGVVALCILLLLLLLLLLFSVQWHWCSLCSLWSPVLDVFPANNEPNKTKHYAQSQRLKFHVILLSDCLYCALSALHSATLAYTMCWLCWLCVRLFYHFTWRSYTSHSRNAYNYTRKSIAARHRCRRHCCCYAFSTLPSSSTLHEFDRQNARTHENGDNDDGDDDDKPFRWFRQFCHTKCAREF